MTIHAGPDKAATPALPFPTVPGPRRADRSLAKRWGLFAGLILVLGGVACQTPSSPTPSTLQPAEARAVAFLAREVPRWERDNHCFSCHNNGDGARALFTAFSFQKDPPRTALGDTSEWLSQPSQWQQHRGDPGFSDKRLAAIQFTYALATGLESGHLTNRSLLNIALRNAVAEQDPDGPWIIEPRQAIASPATYGTPLATAIMCRLLAQTSDPVLATSREKALAWLSHLAPQNVPDAAAVMLGLTGDPDAPLTNALDFILDSQSSSGGWGPWPDAPPEVFDTAIAMLALDHHHDAGVIGQAMTRGRKFLLETQLEDGSWPETTRPSGNVSYAQWISTTAWATLALLASRPY